MKNKKTPNLGFFLLLYFKVSVSSESLVKTQHLTLSPLVMLTDSILPSKEIGSLSQEKIIIENKDKIKKFFFILFLFCYLL